MEFASSSRRVKGRILVVFVFLLNAEDGPTAFASYGASRGTSKMKILFCLRSQGGEKYKGSSRNNWEYGGAYPDNRSRIGIF